MSIMEISNTPKTSDSCACIHLSIDGMQYKLIGCSDSVVVIRGMWIYRPRASIGKSYWDVDKFLASYKKHGRVLLEYVKQLVPNLKGFSHEAQ